MTDVPGSSLAGRCALVTGAGRGIGRAIAIGLADAGADVALVARNAAELAAVRSEIQERGRAVTTHVCDVTDGAAVESMVRDVRCALGRIDILVNNAGHAASHRLVGHPDELWHRLLDVNLTSVYYVTKAVAPVMIGGGWGRIINIASVSSKIGSRYLAAYTASKHGVLGLTRALALELVEHGITVNAICPGYVDTPMTDLNVQRIVDRTGRSADETRALLAGTSPQQRLIEPAEVAALAVFLALDRSKGLTGQAINVDGGAVMW